MSDDLVVLCPKCTQKYRVTRDKLGAKAQCKKCGQGFKIAEQQLIDDDTICGWVTEDDPSSESVLGGTGILRSPASDAREVASPIRWTHQPPPSVPRVTLERIDDLGAYFEFPMDLLNDQDLRASFSHRCVNCQTRSNLLCHLLIWSGKLPGREGFRMKEMETRTIRRLDEWMLRYKLAWFKRLPKIEMLPPPYCEPMPYFVCSNCSVVGEITNHTLFHGDHEFCQIGISNLEIALDFFRNNGGRSTPDYQRLLVAARQQRASEWKRLPFAVRSKISQWFTPQDGEKFLGYYPDFDFSQAERGTSGLILTDRRMVYKKYAANRVFLLEKGGVIKIEANPSIAMVEIGQPGEREVLLKSNPLAASSLARTLTELHLPWQVNIKTVKT